MCKFEVAMTKVLRIKLLLLTTIYFLLSVGFGISTHYCHGNLSSVSYFTSTPDCECGDGLTEMGCCQTIEKIFQLDDESIVPQVLESQFAQLSPVVEHVISIKSKAPDSKIIYQPIVHSGNAPPIYILISSLIFYA